MNTKVEEQVKQEAPQPQPQAAPPAAPAELKLATPTPPPAPQRLLVIETDGVNYNVRVMSMSAPEAVYGMMLLLGRLTATSVKPA